jgi:diguanylate cyclase (GGDEF)-like protein
LVCRYSGDRFAVLLPSTGKQLANIIALEIDAAVRHLAHKTARHGETVRATASIGMALAKNDDPKDLIKQANQQLAIAKQHTARNKAA